MPTKIDLKEAAARLREFYRKTKRPPSYDEIRALFGYRSKNAAHWLVRKLIGKGFFKKDSKGRILLDSLAGTRLLGTVQAGFPSPAEEELVDILTLDEYLIQNPRQSFLIKVTGDSMSGAGILEGDLVVVERGRKPKNHDIVIAQVDGEWTMKYYETGPQGVVRLLAANPKYPPILPRSELTLGGVIVGVIRKY